MEFISSGNAKKFVFNGGWKEEKGITMKKLLIGVVILFIMVTSTGCILYDIQQGHLKNTEYKSIKQVDKTIIGYMTGSRMDANIPFAKIEQLDSDLKEYFSANYSQKEKDALYATYIDNLMHYVGMVDFTKYPDFDGEHLNKIERGYSNSMDGTEYVWAPVGVTSLPETIRNITKFVYAGEGVYLLVPNFYYQIENYGQYLSSTMNEYLTIELSQNYANNTYYNDGDVYNFSQLRLWILDWEAFLKRHPNFFVNDIVQQHIDEYKQGFTMGENAPSYSTNLRKGEFELFFTTNDSSTNSYKEIKKLYDEVNSNNRKAN